MSDMSKLNKAHKDYIKELYIFLGKHRQDVVVWVKDNKTLYEIDSLSINGNAVQINVK